MQSDIFKIFFSLSYTDKTLNLFLAHEEKRAVSGN